MARIARQIRESSTVSINFMVGEEVLTPNGNRKIFIISIDGATFHVLNPLMRQGYMPNLAGMVARGVSSELLSVVPPVTAPAWTSFMTGKEPGKHGIFDFTCFDEKNYSWKINNSDHIRSKTLWQILSEKGKRVIVLNLPYTYPPYEVNGTMVSGWDALFLDQNFTYPESLSKEIIASLPDYAENLDLPLSSNMPTQSDELFDRFTTKIIRGAEQGTELASRFLQNDEWDVCMLHFQQTDWMQHNLWDYIEEGCRDGANKGRRIEKTRQCYQSIDHMIGSLFEKVASLKPLKIVVSDHGFGRNLGNICPNYYLERWGYLFRDAKPDNVVKRFYAQSVRALKKAQSALTRTEGNGKSRKLFQSFGEMIDKMAPHKRVPLDWKRTKAALVVGSETGFVFVNLKGRSPLGTVEPGREYELLISDLIARFSEIRHPQSGEKLLQRIARGSDVYTGRAEGVLIPDIVLIPAEGLHFSYEVSGTPPAVSTHGSHRPEGVVLMEGHGLNQKIDEFSPRLIDMAPTILHALGLPVPTDMDGRVLQEVFASPVDVRFEEADNSRHQQGAMEYNAEKTELIERRLKGLGYLD